MIKLWKSNIKLFWILFVIFACFSLVWCWDSWTWSDGFYINENWFDLYYDWNVELEKVRLKTDDLDEITDLFQEIWDDLDYRDSLLIATKYNQWLWANAFAQDNLDTLVKQWLTLSNINKTQIWFKKAWEDINAVLVEYEITKWLIADIPLLYVSQLFVPKDYDMVLMSYITEDKQSHLNASKMFKNIK